MAAPGTSGLFMVAMVRHELRCGEVFDGGNPLGGVWHVSARSVHDGLPEEKGWERQYKSDRLTCPDRMQNRCYSVQIQEKISDLFQDRFLFVKRRLKPSCHLTHKSATWAKICVKRAKWQRYASNSNHMFLRRPSASSAPSLCSLHTPPRPYRPARRGGRETI